MKRRVMIAAAMTTSLRQMTQTRDKPLQLALPSSQALPARLDMTHVHTVRAVTEHLRGVARYYGGQGDLFGVAATLYTPWLQVPTQSPTRP